MSRQTITSVSDLCVTHTHTHTHTHLRMDIHIHNIYTRKYMHMHAQAHTHKFADAHTHLQRRTSDMEEGDSNPFGGEISSSRSASATEHTPTYTEHTQTQKYLFYVAFIFVKKKIVAALERHTTSGCDVTLGYHSHISLTLAAILHTSDCRK